jgi:hypothetical protein
MSLDPSEGSSRRSGGGSASGGAGASAASAAAAATAAAVNRPLIAVQEQYSAVIKQLFAMQQEGRLCDVWFVLHTADAGAPATAVASLDSGSLDDCDMADSSSSSSSSASFTSTGGVVRIPAHRAVLAASSAYFRTLFNSSMLEATATEIQLPGMRSPLAFRLVLEFLYTGKIMNPTPAPQAVARDAISLGNAHALMMDDAETAASSPAASDGTSPTSSSPSASARSAASIDAAADAILGVLELADLYGIDALHAACIHYLRQRVTVASCVRWLLFAARLPSCLELYQSCFSFLCRFVCVYMVFPSLNCIRICFEHHQTHFFRLVMLVAAHS